LGVTLRSWLTSTENPWMNFFQAVAAVALAAVLSVANAADGLVAVKSPHGTKATMDKLEELVKQRGLNVFARIDHGAGAAKVGKSLRPQEVLIFGNPQGVRRSWMRAIGWHRSASQALVGGRNRSSLAGLQRPRVSCPAARRAAMPCRREPSQSAHRACRGRCRTLKRSDAQPVGRHDKHRCVRR
jgi:hypothetical protein